MSIFYTGQPDHDEQLTAEQKAEAAESTVCLALIGLPELAIAWQAKSEFECTRNRRLHCVAYRRNLV